MKDVNGADVKGRLMSFIKEKRLSKSEFERRCGLSNGYLNSTRGNFGTRKLEGILAAFPELNRDWLLYGKGEMESPVEESPAPLLPNPQTGSDVSSKAHSQVTEKSICDKKIETALLAIQEVTEMRKLLEGTFLSSSAQINKLIDINAEQSHSLVRIADKLADLL